MNNIISTFLNFIFGNNSVLGTYLISMCPMIELKGGIPIGMSSQFWGGQSLNSVEAFLWALAGSSTIIFILPLVFNPILNCLKKTRIFKSLANFVETKVNKHSDEISSKRKSTFLKCLGLFLFVALPLPMTGVWAGCCVGVAIGLDYWQIVFSVFFGNIIAGLVIVSICAIFPAFTTILAYIVLGIIAMAIVIGLIKNLVKKRINN